MFNVSGGADPEDATVTTKSRKIFVRRSKKTHSGSKQADFLQSLPDSGGMANKKAKGKKNSSVSFATPPSVDKKPADLDKQQQTHPETLSQHLVLDGMAFSSMHFSAPTFVNNVTNNVLFPVLLPLKRSAAAGGESTAVGPQHHLCTDDNEAHNANVRLSSTANSAEEYATVATRLTEVLVDALAEVQRVWEEEGRLLHVKKAHYHRVELREKRRLAAVRLGLEGTSARLQEYENHVCNALAATAGIEQHLSQSNARVIRGRSVSQLLKHFKMFTRMSYTELNTVLRGLSKARAEQRVHVTAYWESEFVSPADSTYFGKDNKELLTDEDVGETGRKHIGNGDDNDYFCVGSFNSAGDNGKFGNFCSTNGNYSIYNKENAGGRKGGPFCKGGVQQLRCYSSRGMRGCGVTDVDASAVGGDNSKDGVDGGGSGSGSCEKLHRLEVAAIAAGLDRIFALRSCTEAQVEWCQRLTCLCRELDGIVGGTKNIDLYVDWVRQELVNDVFHLVDCFNKLYKEQSATAAHHVYGRTILRTLELISKLYTTITSSHDSLLSVFYTRTINQIGLKLLSEHSLRPMPAQTAPGDLTASSDTPSAMQHYHSATQHDLQCIFNFFVSCARRDVIIVETICGSTNSARQQLLAQITEGVVKPFVTQQLKLAEHFERDMLEAEARLSPRSKRRASARVADAIAYAHTMHVCLFSFFQMYVDELRSTFGNGETDFLNKYIDTIFTDRTAFVEHRVELELLRRYHTILEEQYTRHLHLVPDEVFEVRDAHIKKSKELIDRFTEVVARTCTYVPKKDLVPCVLDLVRESLKNMGCYMAEELRKSIVSIRTDRENWRVKQKSEEELLRPAKPESQQCGMNMILFVQSCLMNLNDAIFTSCVLPLQIDSSFESAVEEEKEAAFATLDENAEILLNLCANAIIVRSLSILVHYQKRNDYMPKVIKGTDETLVQPCTRACTLFCLYLTRQFEEAKEFIRLSNGQLPQHLVVSRACVSSVNVDNSFGKSDFFTRENALRNAAFLSDSTDLHDAVRARARTMNMQQLLYGDGGPSSFARTVGVCLYRGIVTHLKTLVVSDRGALIYKQDVTAYMEAMRPIVRTPGLGGAVVEVLFSILKETASLLLMPWEHIKEVRDTGLLRLMSNEEKLQFIKMREDLRTMLRQCKD